MSKKYTSIIYFQVPRILHEDKNIKAQHIYIFMILYDQLRQQKDYNKTNQWLSEQTKIGKKQLIIYLNELEELGYLKRTGKGYNRKFKLGNKLNNRAESEPVQKLHSAEKEPVVCGKGSGDSAESESDNKNLSKNKTKKEDFLNSLDQESLSFAKAFLHNRIPLPSEFKWMEPYLNQ